MKKSHHADITKPDTPSDEIRKELENFYIYLVKCQDKHSLIKIKSKNKVTKMISNISVMIQNSSININPHLDEVKLILAFLVSPNIEDTDIRSNAINCLFLLIPYLDNFNKDYLSPIIDSLFSLSTEVDKKQKSSKRIVVSNIFSRFIKQMKSETDKKKRIMWLKIIFYCIFPSLQRQQDPTILSECSNTCIESINRMIAKATDTNSMDFFLKEENSFIIFETASILKNLYNSDDRKLTVLFYSRIFPCSFYYIDLDLSTHKFDKKDDMSEILQSRRYSGWGGPNLLASFNSQPRPFFYQIVNQIVNSTIKDSFMILLEPMLEALCFMLNKIKSSTDIASDIIDLYFIIMRLRNVVKLSFLASTNMSLIDTSFTCMIMYITQKNPLYKEFFPFFLSFYLSILFDSKNINIQEVYNFVSSIISISNIKEVSKTNVMPQICVHVIAMISIALSPFLLDIPKEQSRAFLTNTMEMKISMKPLSLTLMRRITTSNIYFFLQIIGCEFSEIIDHETFQSSSSYPETPPITDSEVNVQLTSKSAGVSKSVVDIKKDNADQSLKSDNWTKETASKFILNLIEAIDSTIGFLASTTVADILLCVLKETSNSNADFIFEKIIPILFFNALNKKPELHVFIPVLHKLVRNAFRYGYLNVDMSHDWFRVFQKYIFSSGSKDIKNELILAAAQSISHGFPMAMSLIPMFIVLINNTFNPDSRLFENESKEELDNISFTKNIHLICSCLAEIIIVSKNNPLFSRSLPIIDGSLRNTILKIFAYNQAFASAFETILLSHGGLKTKCLLLLQNICATFNPNDLKNVEKLIMLLLFNQIIGRNDEYDEENNSIIETILIDNFLKPERLLSLSIEFHQMLKLLLQYSNIVMAKFPNLISSIIYSVSIVFVEQKPIKIDQYEFLLRFVTYLAIITDNNMIMFQCLNIISLPTTAPDKRFILDNAFDTFIYNYKKKINVVNLKFNDMFLFIDSETIYSLKFNYHNDEDKINTLAVQISKENGSNNYVLKYINNSTKERQSINSNDDAKSENSNKPNNRKSKINFKLLREFMCYPSTALLFDVLSESNDCVIKGINKNSKCTDIVNKAFTRDQHNFIDAGVIFIGKNQIHKEEFLANEWENVSKTFSLFLSSIGKLYKPTEIPFLFNNSDIVFNELKNDKAVLCWSDIFHKVIYSVSPLANYGDENRQTQSWNRFKNKRYLVIWLENAKQIDFFAEGFLSEGRLDYAFVVRPYDKNMAILNFFQKRTNSPVFGFFKKSMLLPFDLIGFTISSMLVLCYDMNKQLHESPAVASEKIKQYKDLYENELGNDTIMFSS